jgi:hypothetical protein
LPFLELFLFLAIPFFAHHQVSLHWFSLFGFVQMVLLGYAVSERIYLRRDQVTSTRTVQTVAYAKRYSDTAQSETEVVVFVAAVAPVAWLAVARVGKLVWSRSAARSARSAQVGDRREEPVQAEVKLGFLIY